MYEIDGTLDRMLKLHSEIYGIIDNYMTQKFILYEDKSTGFKIRIGGGIPIHYSFISMQMGLYMEDIKCGGVSLDEKMSLVKAFGEFIERSSAFVTNDSHKIDFVYGNYSVLSNKYDIIDPFNLIGFSDINRNLIDNKFSQYSQSLDMYWVKCEDIIYGGQYLVPAQKVFLRYPMKDNIVGLTLSTGLASHTEFNRAVLSGIEEVIERDAFMLTWLFKIASAKIIVDKIHDKNIERTYNHILHNITGEDKLHLFLLDTLHGTNTILAIITNELDTAARVIVSTETNLNPEKALGKCLEELCQSYKFAYTHKYLEKGVSSKEQVLNLYDHPQYYSNSKANRNGNLSFLFSGEKEMLLSNIENYEKENTVGNLDYYKDMIKGMGYKIIVCDITKEDYKYLGFSVIKVVIPGFTDLELSSALKIDRGKRVEEFKTIYGSELNTEPHPFA